MNEFYFAKGDLEYLSREDGFANFEAVTAVPVNYEMSDEAKDGYVYEKCQPYTINGRILLSGDGVMKPKEDRYAPAVVRLHKESGTQSKPSSFHGIHVGALGIMALGQNHGVYCMPLFMQLMQGLDPVAKWEGSPYVHADMPLELQEIVYMEEYIQTFGPIHSF